MFVFSWMAQNTLWAGALALIVAAACRYGRFSPATRHALWLIVLLKLITPPLVELPLPLPEGWAQAVGTLRQVESESFSDRLPKPLSEAGSPDLVAAGLSSEQQQLLAELWDAQQADRDATAAIDEPHIVALPNGEPPSIIDVGADLSGDALPVAVSVPPAVSTWNSVGWLFALGCVAMLTLQLVRIYRLHRLVSTSTIAEDELLWEVVEGAIHLGVPAPLVRETSQLGTPVVCAVGCPKLLWPASGLERLSAEGKRAIILHELAHLKRRDHWVGWGELVASVLWWWNPLFWYVRHQLHEQAELACDAWVVALLPAGRRAYAEALIDVVDLYSPPRLAGVTLGAGDGSRKLFERRLTMILRDRVRYRIPALGAAGIALLTIVSLASWSVGQTEPPAAQPPLAEAPVVPSSDAQALPPPVDPTVNGDVLLTPKVETPQSAPLAPTLPADVAPIAVFAEPVPPAAVVPPTPSADPRTPVPSASGRQAPFYGARLRPVVGDDRIERLERNLEALMAEVRALRQGDARPAKRMPNTNPTTPRTATPAKRSSVMVEGPAHLPDAASGYPSGTVAPPNPYRTPMGLAVPTADGKHAVILSDSAKPDDVTAIPIPITRALYKLPQPLATDIVRVLNSAIREDQEIDLKVRADGLLVTASEEDQVAIGQMIRFIVRRTKNQPEFQMESTTPLRRESTSSPDAFEPPVSRPPAALPTPAAPSASPDARPVDPAGTPRNALPEPGRRSQT